MSSEERILIDYMAILRHLSTDLKLKLIAKLTDSIIESKTSTEVAKDDKSWRKLFGVWKDAEEDLAEIVRNNRLSNREITSFD